MIHKFITGHSYKRYSDGYDGISPTYSCLECDKPVLVATNQKQKELLEKEYPGIKVLISQKLPILSKDCEHPGFRTVWTEFDGVCLDCGAIIPDSEWVA